MTEITTYLSMVTLNVNGLNSPIKRHHLTNWIKKEDPKICCLQESDLININKHWLRMKGWKKIYQANSPWKQAGVATLIMDKVDFKPTLIKWDKEGHSILVKGEIHQKEITIITQCQCIQFHQTYSEGLKNIHKLQHSGRETLIPPYHQ
jgi:exonuclease III